MNPLKQNTLPRSDRDLAVAPAETHDTGTEIALLLIKAGVLSEKQLSHGTRIKSKLNSQKSLIQVLRELGYFSEEQLRGALTNSRISVKLGSLLVELGYLREADLKAALSIQKNSADNKKLGDILLENHFIAENKLLEALAYQLGFPNLEPEFAQLDRQLLQKTNPRWCKQHCLIPIRVENGRVLIAFADPRDAQAHRETEQIFGVNVAPVIASKRAINEAIAAFERSLKHSPQQVVKANESSPVGLVNALIVDALKANASDIHIEPMREQLRVRFRCDGVLMPYKDLDKSLAPAITSRLKVLANADIAERRRHQDGRIMFEDPTSGQSVDLRLSFYVTIHGEKVVLRLLSRKAQLLAVEEIGLFPKVLERFYHDVLDVPSGVIMITGPTGSGKTTTLYSCINYLNDIERSIITAEDPVEYIVDGIGQCSLNAKIDVTFKSTLPAMVRQDPDVIVLGEIRDNFSAEAAIQAALTGHKVLTTFHTEDTIGGLLRLMNMNIETFLISSTVVSVLAQRLVRKICPSCSESHQPNPTELQRLGYKQADLAGAVFKSGHGCSDCRYTGYQGRIGVYELLILNEMVKDAILNKKTSYEIRRVSIETSGMVTLMEDGLAKAAQGRTTISEVLRHLPRLDKPRSLNEIKRLMGI